MKLIKIHLATCGHCIALWQALEGFDRCEIEEIEVSDRIIQGQMIKKYDLIDVPTLLFVDDNWEIVERLHWLITREQIDSVMDELEK